MKKSEVELRYERGVYRPTINVRHHFYVPDIIKKFADVTATSPRFCQVCGGHGYRTSHTGGKQDHRFKPGGSYHVHEMGEDKAFWEWLDALDDQGGWEYPSGPLCIAEEIARESAWEDAHEMAYEVWGSKTVRIYSEGRSGGWLVVDGLGDIDDWDAVELMRWVKFNNLIKGILDDLDYQFAWHAHANVYEHIHNLQGVI